MNKLGNDTKARAIMDKIHNFRFGYEMPKEYSKYDYEGVRYEPDYYSGNIMRDLALVIENNKIKSKEELLKLYEDEQGNNALHLCVSQPSKENMLNMLKYILWGFDPLKENHAGYSAFDCAIRLGDDFMQDAFSFLLRSEQVKEIQQMIEEYINDRSSGSTNDKRKDNEHL